MMGDRFLVGMSGGVDSSVAAALLLEQGHEVVGVTMKLWGGDSDSGCCSVADVDDARRVAQQLGIDHLVFNFTVEFDERVVDPYVAAWQHGRTPNPCIDCNRHLKFDRLLRRAEQLGFDAVATGHHCAIGAGPDGRLRLRRGADRAKDQSYVVHVLRPDQLARVRFPLGTMTKADVRALAARLGLRTATKPDSQDVCFITATGGRATFLGARIPLHPGRVVDEAGAAVGAVDAVELVTIGQRRGLGGDGGGARRYVTDVDVAAGVVRVGDEHALARPDVAVGEVTWLGPALGAGARVLAQVSAHGVARPARWRPDRDDPVGGAVVWDEPQRRVAPGQSVVLYDPSDTEVLGGGCAR